MDEIVEPMRVVDLIEELKKLDPMRFVTADGAPVIGIFVYPGSIEIQTSQDCSADLLEFEE